MSHRNTLVRLTVIAAAVLAPLAASAQNITSVNGKPVPKARADMLLNQATPAGQQRTPEFEQRARDEVVLREIFAQEAEKRGIPASADYRAQLELLRQTVLIRELFEDFKKKNPVSDADWVKVLTSFLHSATDSTACGAKYHSKARSKLVAR